ncbi:helix-turn-helix domain containing protein [Cognatishimia sp. SS12]|uniref:TetR/AcrR family transcriptional regulator n=1 Tax=Cognatishimia sp. SS12 TaxID=2979465 RepID=UPI002330BAB6|nr:TetR/AcrR family transcriptional regulator [Cognatishimia sp. SS12]MDC0736964.1 helix-turn-helix domain containing protein [Cognatishimia sp. SS12]
MHSNDPIEHPPETAQLDDPKATAILHAAFATFSLYGYRRSAMADIAKAAGISRAALYLHFKNKEDILRGMMQRYYQGAEIDFAAALGAPGVVMSQLQNGFAALSGETFRQLLNAPHGHELLDVKAEAGPVVAEGEAALARVLAQYLRDAEAAGRISLDLIGADADAAAGVMMQAYKGLKQDGPSYEVFCEKRDQLARIYAAALMR